MLWSHQCHLTSRPWRYPTFSTDEMLLTAKMCCLCASANVWLIDICWVLITSSLRLLRLLSLFSLLSLLSLLLLLLVLLVLLLVLLLCLLGLLLFLLLLLLSSYYSFLTHSTVFFVENWFHMCHFFAKRFSTTFCAHFHNHTRKHTLNCSNKISALVRINS